MYLKRIEIAGFKSFADKTTIEFNQGLTAVVGPNGSGKSNITEAIRWVLGEQSAKNLRGGTMPDVIFAGSSTRPALNVATVTLVLDNEERFLPIDYSEVSITRRLTRSGESDFFINKQNCRMKDVVNLFMDSGLGKESFSIISQGKVEAIFNSKPEDRRGIFEEAAGVLKYKTRKKEAEKKLLETDDNLSRVEDIIYELEAQLTPLKEQSTTATQFLSYKKELSNVDVAITVQKIDKENTLLKKTEEELAAIFSDIKEKRTLLEQKESQLNQLRTKRETLEETIEVKQKELLETTTEFEQLEGKKHVLAERQRFSVQNKNNHEESMKSLIEKEQNLKSDIATLKKEEAAISQEKKSVIAEIETLSKQLQHFSKSTKEQLDDLRSDYVNVMQQETNINNDLKHLEKQYEKEMIRSQKDVDMYDKLVIEEQEIKEQQKTNEQLLATQQNKVKTLLETYKKRQQEVSELKKVTENHEAKMYDALKIVHQAQAKEKSLKELKASYSGFYQGVRSVLKEKERLGGIVGAVAELIEVPKEVSLAIETALGASAQHIITENEQSARKAISYLKQKRDGRATFLPLTTIKKRQLSETTKNKVINHPGFIGIASELIGYPTSISQVIENLLGLTIIAKDLTAANELAKTIQFQNRVVSLEGDIMNPGGSMTGGASKRGQSNQLFSQESELKQLENQVAQMQKLYQTKEKEVKELKTQLAQKEESLEQLRHEGEEARLLERNLANEVESDTQKAERHEKERRAFEYEKRELQRFLEDYTEEKEQLTEAKENLLKKKVELDELMNQTSQMEEENNLKKEEVQQQLHEQQANLAVASEKYGQIKSRLKEKKQLSDEIGREKDQIQSHILTESDTHLSQNEQNQQIEEKLVQLKSRTAANQTTLNELKDKRDALMKEIAANEQLVGVKNQEIQEAMDVKTKREVLKNTANLNLDRELAYLQEEYQVTFEAAKLTTSENIDFEAGQEQIKDLKHKIKRLGAVNVEAIEQYKEVNERYQFLVAQQEDLVLAKRELVETMSDMDGLVIKKFHDVFCDIRDEFKQVFPNMFGGGHADLVLTDPTDLLNTGIDIVAQPPGKKLQNLSLLSGGERALTAIALLFAIIQARPVPFCILDEVEAALDDANVARYGNYLRHFGKEMQFIVITHRKGTMEAANVLYGVTMQESGISKIVSVQLEGLEKEADFGVI